MAKVIIGMSGGVDSSVAAFLLKEQGHEVVGAFMRNWDSVANNDILGNKNATNQEKCPEEKDWADAQEVAKKLGIEIHRVDFVKEYWDYVFAYFIKEYKMGRTPNPDILCNKYIKFDKFMEYAFNELGADYIAMGHYAKQKDGELFRAKDMNKDQTYFLSQLSKEQISKSLFPLSDLTKPEIRKIAVEQGLVTANKPDSTGICFIGERNFTQFLQNYIATQPGEIRDITTGEIIGNHIGVMYYTIGQRKGLNLGGMNEPYFVAGHDMDKKIIWAAPASKNEYLLSDKLEAVDVNFNTDNFNIDNITVKFRYRQTDVKAKLEIHEDKIILSYDLFEAVTPGQQVVLYDGEKCIGGATIDKIFRNGKKIEYV
ncbi:tRNA 2-thiouridine(34) synthase MnmA [Mycoplasma marinum]|uniref:tRNA-specific 2-thiouridylase MnmA n=1 Tax=Mycoplasma marinum TaxID=1937190 RepID=A0A4V2NIC2_9MOLU|nr:tRNA 2-thiouridine(34) synthase MnmA [Mycoplasma marinum]TCG11721.1 tRNA 2-thiouridine(34) synthase MnmA [Mycoplasma marinum]